jgi:hypothetical protein
LREVRIQSILLAMQWTTPAYDEIKMDAEIGSYQEDGDPVPIVENQKPGDVAAPSVAAE